MRKTIEILLINCEVSLILIWSADCVISAANGSTKFAKTDKKLYVPAVISLANDNVKLLPQLKSGSKRTTNWNKY